jgi:hypothetical protein
MCQPPPLETTALFSHGATANLPLTRPTRVEDKNLGVDPVSAFPLDKNAASAVGAAPDYTDTTARRDKNGLESFFFLLSPRNPPASLLVLRRLSLQLAGNPGLYPKE